MCRCKDAPDSTKKTPAPAPRCAPADDNFFEQFEPTRYLLWKLWRRAVVFPLQMQMLLLRFWLAKQRLILLDRLGL